MIALRAAKKGSPHCAQFIKRRLSGLFSCIQARRHSLVQITWFGFFGLKLVPQRLHSTAAKRLFLNTGRSIGLFLFLFNQGSNLPCAFDMI